MKELARIETWPDVIVASTRAQLLIAVSRAQRRGELAAVGPCAVADVGVHYVRVLRLKPPAVVRRRWPWVAGGVVVVLAGAAAVGWWLASALALVLPMALGGVALLVVGSMLSRPSGCTVTHRRG